MSEQLPILCIAGPTASGKSGRAVEEAKRRGGEVISVDSRQVYRGLDIGTEKITREEMSDIPHHLIDIRDAKDPYSAGDFVKDADRLITDIHARGKFPILAGGTHFYFDALLSGLPAQTDADTQLRDHLEQFSDQELFAQIQAKDVRRAGELDPKNRRRLVRALEIIEKHGKVPERASQARGKYAVDWIILNPTKEELQERIAVRLKNAFEKGLIDEVRRVRDEVGDKRLNELGLEHKVIGEFLRGEREESSLFPTLSSRLWHYARRQKAWLRKLSNSHIPKSDSR